MVRFHHAYFDGLSYLMAMKKFFQVSGHEYIIDPKKYEIPTQLNRIVYLNLLLKFPYTLVSYAINKYTYPQKYWKPSAPVKTGIRYFRQIPIELEKINIIRNKTNRQVNVTDILSTAVALALGNILPEDKMLNQVQIFQILAMLPYPNENLQNRFTAFHYPVSTKLLNDNNPLDNLRHTHAQCGQYFVGETQHLVGWYLLDKFFGRMPQLLFRLFTSGTSSSIMLSSIPASKKQCSFFDGVSICGIEGWVIQPDGNGKETF